MEKLLTLDPGRETLAWAAFGQGELVEVDLSRLEVGPIENLGSIALRHAAQVPSGADLVVVEQMVQYPTHARKDTRQRQDALANDLLDLQAIGGIVAARCVSPGGSILYTAAREWKGMVEKAITRQRVERALGPREAEVLAAAMKRTPAKLRHNLVDAVGIGLWQLRRMRAR